MAEGWVEVKGAATGFAQEITVGSHHLRGDEPATFGGTDTGPTPYDLLLAALGTCKSMTAAMYARRKQWPLESVTVRLHHDKIHAKDCEECETREGKIDRIACELTFAGNLSDEQRAQLLSIADRCPVHRTLTAEIHIASRLV